MQKYLKSNLCYAILYSVFFIANILNTVCFYLSYINRIVDSAANILIICFAFISVSVSYWGIKKYVQKEVIYSIICTILIQSMIAIFAKYIDPTYLAPWLGLFGYSDYR